MGSNTVGPATIFSRVLFSTCYKSEEDSYSGSINRSLQITAQLVKKFGVAAENHDSNLSNSSARPQISDKKDSTLQVLSFFDI